MKFPKFKVDAKVNGVVVMTSFETATNDKAAIAKLKFKMRNAVSNAGAFEFEATPL